VASGKNTTTRQTHAAVWCVAFPPHGGTLASAGSDGVIRLWDVATGKNTATLKGHTGSVRSIAFSPDGKALASCSTDKSIRLWDLAGGK
jgi:WD40 repeat protein